MRGSDPLTLRPASKHVQYLIESPARAVACRALGAGEEEQQLGSRMDEIIDIFDVKVRAGQVSSIEKKFTNFYALGCLAMFLLFGYLAGKVVNPVFSLVRPELAEDNHPVIVAAIISIVVAMTMFWILFYLFHRWFLKSKKQKIVVKNTNGSEITSGPLSTAHAYALQLYLTEKLKRKNKVEEDDRCVISGRPLEEIIQYRVVNSPRINIFGWIFFVGLIGLIVSFVLVGIGINSGYLPKEIVLLFFAFLLVTLVCGAALKMIAKSVRVEALAVDRSRRRARKFFGENLTPKTALSLYEDLLKKAMFSSGKIDTWHSL